MSSLGGTRHCSRSHCFHRVVVLEAGMRQKKGGDALQPITNRITQPKNKFRGPLHNLVKGSPTLSDTRNKGMNGHNL